MAIRRFAAGLLLLATAVAPAAYAVTLLDDQRNVNFFSDDGNSNETPATPFADFSVTGQTSTVSADRFLGVGSGEGFSDFDFFIRESTFDITFSVDVATQIALEGTLFGQNGDFGLGSASVSLTSLSPESGGPLFSDIAGGGNFATYEFFAVLNPGVYRLQLFTIITPGGFDTFAEWTLDASFAAVPLPAAFWLLGSACLAMLGVRRRAISQRR